MTESPTRRILTGPAVTVAVAVAVAVGVDGVPTASKPHSSARKAMATNKTACQIGSLDHWRMMPAASGPNAASV